MQIYLGSTEDTVRQIEQAAAIGDAESLRRGAHTLKSSSANIGAETLSDLFRQLETLGRENKLEMASPLLCKMRQAYELTTQEIHQLLENN